MGLDKKKGKKDEAAGVDPEGLKEVKKRGAIGNLYLKGLGSVGLVENTHLDKIFVESIMQHEEYRRLVDQMFNSVELLLQPNPEVLADGKLNEDAMTKIDAQGRPYMNPLKRVARGIERLSKLLPPPAGQIPDPLGPTERFILQSLPAKLDEMAEVEKGSRTNVRHSMNRTRLFVSRDFEAFKDNRREIGRNLLVMDDMRNQVKKAKTKAELEKAGRGYTVAVHEFNRRAELIDRVLEGHPENVYFHQRDLGRLFVERARFHEAMGRKVQEWDNDVTVMDVGGKR